MKHVIEWSSDPKTTVEIQLKWLEIWKNCDAKFGDDLQKNMAFERPGQMVGQMVGQVVGHEKMKAASGEA